MPTGSGGGGGGAKTPFVRISGIGQATSASVTTLAVPVPAGVANGDFMVMLFGTQPGATVAPTPPAGWTSITSTQVASNNASILACYRTAASEPASYTVSWTTAATPDGVIVGFRGLTGVIDNSATNNANLVSGLNSIAAPGTINVPTVYLFAAAGAASTGMQATGFTNLAANQFHEFVTALALVGTTSAIQLITPYPIYYSGNGGDGVAALAVGFH